MMSTAFIKAAMDQYPHAEIDLIVKSGFEHSPLPHRGRILPFDKSLCSIFEFGQGLRERQYDAIFVLPTSFSSALMAFWARIPTRIGYQQNGRSLFLKPARSYPQKHRTQHLIDEYLYLLGNRQKTKRYFPNLNISQNWIDQIISNIGIPIPETYVILAPGAMYGPAKQWPIPSFKKLAGILNQWSVKTIVVGNNQDFNAGEHIVDGLDHAQNLCGKTNLSELIALMEKSALLVSNDSGAMHIMAALQKPQIAIFGSTSTIWTGPMNPNANILQEKLSCSPCFKRECPLTHYDCLNKITPRQLADQINHILQII